MRYDPTRARLAVQFLVDSSYFHHHVTKLRSTILKPRAMPFKDAAEVLNELLVIGRQNEQAMENLIAVAEQKRGGKNEYQRQYMAAKRKRDRKVLALEELLTGKKLAAPQRADVLRRQYAVWDKERDALLRTLSDTPWRDRNERIKAFWERKEAEIDALCAEAQANGPVKRRRVVRVEQPPKTEFGKALVKAVKGVDRKR